MDENKTLHLKLALKINAAAEVLRPNVKDVLYQLDINTFKDGLLSSKDHAGVLRQGPIDSYGRD